MMCDPPMSQGSLMAICSSQPDRFHCDWVDLETPGGVIQVTAQPLRVDGPDGMIVPVSARTARRIAEVLGAGMVSPDVADMIWAQATVKIGPHLMPNNGSWEQARQWSAWADSQLAQHRVGAETLVSFGDKIWWLDAAGKPVNYGLHVWQKDCNHAPWGDGESWGGMATYPTATETAARVIQPIGHAHNMDHVDYSQHCRLWRAKP